MLLMGFMVNDAVHGRWKKNCKPLYVVGSTITICIIIIGTLSYTHDVMNEELSTEVKQKKGKVQNGVSD